jgi:hypothetical protein
MGDGGMLAAFAAGAALATSLAVQASDVVTQVSLASNVPTERTQQQNRTTDARPELTRVAALASTAVPTQRFLTGNGPISAVWANTGEDKVTREELRARKNTVVPNSAWTGTQVSIFGAKNEVVAFNLVLEAATTAATDVTVEFDTLTGPGGAKIESVPTDKNGVYNWLKRDIELFQVRYLQIKGLSQLSYGTYDERHIPEKLRRPLAADGSYSGGWSNRPNHDKYYPDIALPLEIDSTFSIAAGNNQSIWVDVYVPKDSPPGIYTGEVLVRQGGTVAYRVPVQLEVLNFALPDMPSSKTMLATSYHDVAKRYTGVEYPNPGTTEDTVTKKVMRRQFLLAHRHKISLIDDNSGADAWAVNRPRPYWVPALNGNLFTDKYGYRGPGEGVGNNVFSVGTFGGWQDWWGTPTAAKMANRTNAWETWFTNNSPDTERFLYLIDESTDYAQTQKWAKWMKDNTGIGRNMNSFATVDLVHARNNIPSLDISASWIAVADTASWNEAAQRAEQSARKKVYMYNGVRPASGSFAIEDEGIALRELAWGQYKKNIDRWFFWNATYYNDYQGGRGDTNVFKTAQTFGGAPTRDPNLGMSGWNASNGDGVLFYPGMDAMFPAESLGVSGPIASLRLKFWRRGIQDIDYVTLAARINPTAVDAIVKSMVPKVMWEVGVSDPADPTWVLAPISWSIDPEKWEAVRRQLADIIAGAGS